MYVNKQINKSNYCSRIIIKFSRMAFGNWLLSGEMPDCCCCGKVCMAKIKLLWMCFCLPSSSGAFLGVLMSLLEIWCLFSGVCVYNAVSL